MDQETLYDAYDHNADNTSSANANVVQQFLAAYSCPTDLVQSGDKAIPKRGIADVPGAEFQYSSYRGVEGRVEPPDFFAADRHSWNTLYGWVGFPETNRGMFHLSLIHI